MTSDTSEKSACRMLTTDYANTRKSKDLPHRSR